MTNNKLLELVEQLKKAKAVERQANANRLQVESEIYKLVEKDLKETGVNNFDGGLKITTGYTAKWDMEHVQEMYDAGEITVFPFIQTFKPDNKLINSLEKINKSEFVKLQEAVVLTNKKPSFEIKEAS